MTTHWSPSSFTTWSAVRDLPRPVPTSTAAGPNGAAARRAATMSVWYFRSVFSGTFAQGMSLGSGIA